jgi:hypothetical protein
MEYGAKNNIWDGDITLKVKWRPNLKFLQIVIHYVNYINVVHAWK